MRIYRSVIFAAIALLLLSSLALAAPSERVPESTPAELYHWRDWVLFDKPDRLCPTAFNEGGTYRCGWPSRLRLDLTRQGGTFEQDWIVLARGWQPLAGDAALRIWPRDVRLSGKPVPVIDRNGTPSIFMPPGEYTVTGRFHWLKLPETIQVPPAIGLIELTIDGRRVDSLSYDAGGRLWLQARDGVADEEDRLRVHVYRLLNDTIPMRITTLFRLEVSGRAREIELAEVLLEGTRVLALDSPLPAKLGSQGALLVQARPGQWDLRVEARSMTSVDRLTAPGRYSPEIWSVQAQNHIRMATLSGSPSVEPAQTDMPPEWRNFPAFLVEETGGLAFQTLRRGDADPAPDRLTLARTWWLDIDGRGFTLQDQLKGTLSRQWYVAMRPPFELGRVAVDGVDRVITKHGPSELPGVELRRGVLNLVAEARYEGARFGTMPAVGWEHDFQKVTGVLNLPPGWRLLGATGVDRMDGSWIQRWTLLDFFVVLIITLAVFKLRNWRWGLLALVTMALMFQEPNAPIYVWLHILAVMALLKVLPEGKIRGLVKLWGVAAIVFLLVVSIPFMVQQVRWGLYPQLAHPQSVGFFPGGTAPAPATVQRDAREAVRSAEVDQEVAGSIMRTPSMAKFQSGAAPAIEQFDPQALVQTGPGLPRWRWGVHRFEWNGPVQSDQTMRLWLVPPMVNFMLAILRVLLLGAFILGVVSLKDWWQVIRTRLKPATQAAGLAVLLLMAIGPHRSQAAGAAFPPPALLKQLEDRLLEKPDCLPACADIAQLALTAGPDRLQILLEVHAAVQTAIPLPVTPVSWTPEAILLDQEPAPGLARDADGQLWLLVGEGIHTIVLTGRIAPGVTTLQIPFPMPPHTAAYSAEGWQVTGIDADGNVAGTVQLTSEKPADAQAADDRTQALPPFLHVERTLHLGLTWQVSTTVTRITPPGASVLASIPLLAGEAVTTAGIDTAQGAALIDMGPSVRQVRYHSVLALSPTLTLQAPLAVPWTETWILDASPIWHCETSGIPVIHHQGKQGLWQPEWRPWPGEAVDIRVTRPEAVPGRTITLDAVDLTFVPGQRFDRSQLKITARTSKGGRHEIELPAAAALQLVTINGKSLPVRLEDRIVPLPLEPGSQDVLLEWHQPSSARMLMHSPALNLGEQAVNANVSFKMPADRWIIFAGGPRLGPAVLFWSYLIVMVLAALALARTRFTPLRYASWLLLSVGLTQVSIVAALIVVGWFFALAWRETSLKDAGWLKFNGVQLLLVVWTIAALAGLYTAVERGLLGTPDMQIAGNASTRFVLNWTQDRIDAMLPQPWVLVLPMWIYRVLMLFWSLWLALALLKWLRWGWSCYSRNGIWKKPPPRKRKPKQVWRTPEETGGPDQPV